MTIRCRFRLWLGITVAGLATHALLYFCVGISGDSEAVGDLSTRLKNLLPVSIAVFGASLAAAFRYRIAFSQNLREFYWRELVPAVQLAIRYTALPKPKQTDYADTLAALSTAIDGVRAIYTNVGRKAWRPGHRRGLYPFEPLKLVHGAIEALPPSKAGGKASKAAKKQIASCWKCMSEALFRDFERVVPTNPVTAAHLALGKDVQTRQDRRFTGPCGTRGA